MLKMLPRVDQKSFRPEKVVISPEDAVTMVQLGWSRDLKAVHACTKEKYTQTLHTS